MSTSRYTHGHHASVLRSHSNRTVENSAAYLAPLLTKDATLLDIGAGPGTITADLAQRVAHVVATEIDTQTVSITRQTISELDIDNVDFSVEDVCSLSFPDDTFDFAHAHQVLQHVSDPVQGLREMRRVVKPGGTVAVRDSDYSGFVWFPESPQLGEWMRLYQQAARDNGGDPDAGRRLKSWALEAGFSKVWASSSTWCYSTEQETQWWSSVWAERIVESDIARQLVDSKLATLTELREIAEGWRKWAQEPAAWFSVLHGEILAQP